jgi:hypothetical protein
MTWYLLNVFVHIMCSILWIGYVIFWLTIARPLERRFEPAESTRILGVVNAAEWPPRAIPTPFRLTLSQVAWLLLFVFAATGMVMLLHKAAALEGGLGGLDLRDRFGGVLAAKLALVGVLALLQLRLGRRPGLGVVYGLAGASLLVVVLSAVLARAGSP